MISVASKQLLRDMMVGFGLGLVLMLGLSYGTAMLSHPTPAAKTSAQ